MSFKKEMNERFGDSIYTEQTVVPKDKAALIESDKPGLFELTVPDMEDDAEVGENILFLAAIMARAAEDADFFYEQINWMKGEKQ